ncbi:MAG: putative sugar O-methyltransferase [Planctomycetota bacterium]|nr:putative sugar O-methyltransferase [Planctomycetota bacterium]
MKTLQERYASLSIPPIDHSEWTSSYVNSNIDLRFFRGDNAYVYQYRDGNREVNYVVTYYYLQKIDELRLLQKLDEDGLFGAYTFNVNGRTVSRDLLDSIAEVSFLERHLAISRVTRLNILDIGAGYGRLAHRMTQALPNIGRYICVDAVAESTFISEYYLRFRGVAERAAVIPIFDVDDALANNPINLAMNVHSFSECTLLSTVWWLDALRKHKVKYLMIVPNPESHGGTLLLSTEKDKRRQDLLPAIHTRGYKLKVREPKYTDPSVQNHGVTPTYHYLFELTS